MTEEAFDKSRYLDDVLAAFEVTQDLGLDLKQTASVFGVDNVAESPLELRNLLCGLESCEVAGRARLVAQIKSELDALISNPNKQENWADQKRPELQGKSVKDLMVSGHIDNLKNIVEFLKRVII